MFAHLNWGLFSSEKTTFEQKQNITIATTFILYRQNHLKLFQRAEKLSVLTRRTSGCCRALGRPPEEPAAAGTAARSLRWSHQSSRCRCGGHSNRSHPSWDSSLGDTAGRAEALFKWVMEGFSYSHGWRPTGAKWNQFWIIQPLRRQNIPSLNSCCVQRWI